MLEVNRKAPDFTLSDKDGRQVSLSDFLGKKVVLYFYPKDNTPGCTRQACAFAAAYEQFKEQDVVVIGISKDSTASIRNLRRNTICPSSCCPTRSCRQSRHMTSGRKRSFTERSVWAWCVPPILLMNREISKR